MGQQTLTHRSHTEFEWEFELSWDVCRLLKYSAKADDMHMSAPGAANWYQHRQGLPSDPR